MSTLIVSTFPDAWALVVDLEPDVRTIRRIRGVKPPTLHQITLSPADAARLDLGEYTLALSFDGRDRPVVFLINHEGDALLWPCHRPETSWISDDVPHDEARAP